MEPVQVEHERRILCLIHDEDGNLGVFGALMEDGADLDHEIICVQPRL
jgi:hypothetical protein